MFPYTSHFRDWIVAGNSPPNFDRDYIQHATAIYLANSTGLYSEGSIEALDPEEIINDFMADRTETLFQEADTPILADLNPWLDYYYFHVPIN